MYAFAHLFAPKCYTSSLLTSGLHFGEFHDFMLKLINMKIMTVPACLPMLNALHVTYASCVISFPLHPCSGLGTAAAPIQAVSGCATKI